VKAVDPACVDDGERSAAGWRRPLLAVSRAAVALAPRPSDYAGLRASWKGDVVAGVTVGVVALPLALAFGLASGLGAGAGLITAIVAGAMAGVFGGSSVQVSGPTGAMAVVLAPIVAHDGAGAVVLVGGIAGLILILAAILKVGRFVTFMPWPVIEGFTVGIAAIIFLQQVPNALGVPKPAGTHTAVVAAKATWSALHGDATIAAIALALLVALVMTVLPRLHRSVPASLLAVVVATVVAQVAHLPVARLGALPHSLPIPALPGLSASRLSALAGAGFAVAALSGIESLLSAKVADGMADGRPHDPDRELFGQGLANMAVACFGGMPATGAIARTAVNARAGARTRVAAIVHSLVLLLVVFLFAGAVSRIPLAALAAVLMVTAVRMVEPHNVKAVIGATRGDALVLIVTAAITIAFDLILAVEVGIAIAAVLALRSVARATSIETQPIDPELDTDTEHQLLADHILVYRIDGAVFFGAAQRFLTELTAVSDVKVVILRLSGVQVLDATGANALEQTIEELEARGVTVLLKGVPSQHRQALASVGAFERLASEHHVFDTLPAAIAHAETHVHRALASTSP
jgi:SulP family sulfate permease